MIAITAPCGAVNLLVTILYDTNMDIRKVFNEHFPVVAGSKKKPYIVLIDALIGYGKSYVSQKLASIDGSLIIDNNQVRYYLDDYSDRYAKEWHELQHQRVESLLKSGNSLIVDECLPINYQKKLDFYGSLGVPMIIVRLNCDDEVWEQRLKARRFDPPHEYSVINYDVAVELNSRYPTHVPDELVDFTIDTTNNVDIQVRELVEFIKRQVNNY